MDRLIVERKLDSLRHCLERIASKRPASVAALERDADLQDVLTLNLSRAVQICVDIGAHGLVEQAQRPPNTMGETFDGLAQAGVIDAALALRMKKAVGFRNVAVHAYERIDWQIVYMIATRDQDDFRHFAAAVAQWLDRA